jgi:hypothetical protein
MTPTTIQLGAQVSMNSRGLYRDGSERFFTDWRRRFKPSEQGGLRRSASLRARPVSTARRRRPLRARLGRL